MAKISLTTLLSGTLGDFSVYTQRGVKGAIIRSKGGPSAKQIKTEPKFEGLRLHQTEFGGVGKLNGYLLKACKGVKKLADFNFSGQFSKRSKLIQNLDTVNPPGQRSIVFSKAGPLYNGFDMNNTNPFDSVVRLSPDWSITRNEVKAMVSFPELHPAITLKNPWNLPMVRFVLALGNIPDLIYNNGYMPANPLMKYANATVLTGWKPSNAILPAFTEVIQLSNDVNLDDTGTLLLSVGIEFGFTVTNVLIVPGKHSGCAKILGLG